MKYSNNKLARYSIRKYSIGVASVLIVFSLWEYQYLLIK